MPQRDRTGPMGYGSMTGRRLGPCGGGFAFGRRFCQRYAEPVALTKDEQKKVLEAELKQIDTEKQELEKKLKEMEE